jgi:PadR family transcriptional regulator PadR
MDLESANRKFQKELNAGAGALMVLGLLVRTGRPMYGYEIGKHLQELAEDELPMHHGALYPTLRSLERGGLLASKVASSASGPLRRYYQVTALGKKALESWLAAWQRTKSFIDAILESDGGRHVPRKTPGDRQVPEGAKDRARSASGSGRRGSTR